MPIAEVSESVAPYALSELVVAVRALFEGFDERSYRILSERIFAFDKQATLEELGQEFSLTRERVRQVEVAILKKLNARLGFPAFACINNAAQSMATGLGLMVPKQSLDELSHLVATSAITASCPYLLPLLLWIGGPYALVDGWVIRKPIGDTTEKICGFLPEAGCLVPLAEVQAALREAGALVKEPVALLNHFGYRILGDNVLLWRGTLADKAFAVLKNADRAMTREEISAQIPEEHSIRTLGNYLFDDERFIRINLTDFALSSTGIQAYRGIVDELSAEITRKGGEATLEHLRKSLMERFGVSERSIISYLASPLFARTSRGNFRIRREDEDFAVQTKTELTRSCFLINGNWAYRLVIDDELIRGSGRNVPSGFASGIGIGPGESATFISSLGDYRIAWIGPQPTVGSVRRFVEAHSLVVGDWLYLAPQGSEIDVYVLRSADQARMTELGSLLAQTCPAGADSSEPEKEIARSIGLSPTDNWTGIRRRFLERKEADLYALVPEDEMSANEQDTLANLFQYIGSEAL